MPGYDVVQDAIVLALRNICSTEVNAAAAPVLGADYPAIKKTYGFPIPLKMLATLELPALSIYIERVERAPQGSRFQKDERLSIVMEYVGPPTSLEKLDTTWPLLRALWSTCLEKIEEGTIASVDVLRVLKVMWLNDAEAFAVFDHAVDGEYSFPSFVGRFQLDYRPDTLTGRDSLANFTEIMANLDLYEKGLKTVDNIVTVNGRLS